MQPPAQLMAAPQDLSTLQADIFGESDEEDEDPFQGSAPSRPEPRHAPVLWHISSTTQHTAACTQLHAPVLWHVSSSHTAHSCMHTAARTCAVRACQAAHSSSSSRGACCRADAQTADEADEDDDEDPFAGIAPARPAEEPADDRHVKLALRTRTCLHLQRSSQRHRKHQSIEVSTVSDFSRPAAAGEKLGQLTAWTMQTGQHHLQTSPGKRMLALTCATAGCRMGTCT